jgi:hypothetical protein
LREADPEMTQIPARNRAAIAKIAVFVLLAEVNENFTAKMNRTVRRII